MFLHIVTNNIFVYVLRGLVRKYVQMAYNFEAKETTVIVIYQKIRRPVITFRSQRWITIMVAANLKIIARWQQLWQDD